MEPTPPTPDWVLKRWDGTHGSFIAGRAYLDGVDELAARLEWYWGCDRLRLVVGPELREKFDRQRYKLQAAIQKGTLEDMRRECLRMMLAWETLDVAAHAAGALPKPLQVWELTLEDGTVAAIVPDAAMARSVIAEKRQVAVYTLDEIARLLEINRELVAAKLTYPGVTVVRTKRQVDDPLQALDPLGFDVPFNDEIPQMS
jgi:hypothetical protein